MLRKIKSVLLLCLMAGAAMSVNGAWHSIHRGQASAALPSELTVRFAGRRIRGAESPGSRRGHRHRDRLPPRLRPAPAEGGHPRRRQPGAAGPSGGPGLLKRAV